MDEEAKRTVMGVDEWQARYRAGNKAPRTPLTMAQHEARYRARYAGITDRAKLEEYARDLEGQAWLEDKICGWDGDTCGIDAEPGLSAYVEQRIIYERMIELRDPAGAEALLARLREDRELLHREMEEARKQQEALGRP